MTGPFLGFVCRYMFQHHGSHVECAFTNAVEHSQELRPNERSFHACLVACDKAREEREARDVQWARALWLFNGVWDNSS